MRADIAKKGRNGESPEPESTSHNEIGEGKCDRILDVINVK